MDELKDFIDLQGNNLNEFVTNYRDEMKRNYDDSISELRQQRMNDHASIMANANKRGMMYSNFPERQKMQYDTNTYDKNRIGAYQSYQTGLDKLRANALSAWNTIKDTQEMIAHTNKLNQNKGSGDDDGGDDAPLWGSAEKSNKGTTFYDNDGNKIRFATWAANRGATDNESVLEAAKEALIEQEYERLKNIVEMQKNTKTPNLKKNTGKSHVDYDYIRPDGTRRFSQEDADFLNRLGLAF